ncbi:hypothetical protein Tco_0059999 [Tanacetum coccineum]
MKAMGRSSSREMSTVQEEHRDRLPACLAHMLFCVVVAENNTYTLLISLSKESNVPELLQSQIFQIAMLLLHSSSRAPKTNSTTSNDRGKATNTSSSSIDYIPKSPTSTTSPSPNGYLKPSTSPPLRVSPPPPTQDNASMDITLTLSPNTPLDVQFDTPSPSPPIIAHPIP